MLQGSRIAPISALKSRPSALPASELEVLIFPGFLFYAKRDEQQKRNCGAESFDESKIGGHWSKHPCKTPEEEEEEDEEGKIKGYCE